MQLWLRWAIPILLLLFGLGLRAIDPPLPAALRLKVFDFYQAIKPRVYVPVSVRIIDIDDESLERFGQWRWPRVMLADLVDRLSKAEVAAIAFAIIFSEPDRTSPARVSRIWRVTPEIEPLLGPIRSLPDHDEIFADAIRNARVVTGFVGTEGEGGKVPELKAGFAFAGDDPRDQVPSYPSFVVNLPEIEAAAMGNGSLNIVPDNDGIVRRVPLLVRHGKEIYPQLSVEALRVAQGASTYVVKVTGSDREIAFGARTGITHVKIGEFVAPTDKSGMIWLYDTGPIAERTIPAWRILSGDFDPVELRGAIVFIGASAAGLGNIHATPLSPVTSGAEISAQIAEQILTRSFLLRPDWGDGAEIIYIFVLGAMLIYAVLRLGAAWGAALMVVWLGSAVVQSWYFFSATGLLLDPLYASFMIVLLYLACSTLTYVRAEAERREVRSAFGRFLSPVLVEQLARDPSRLELGGEIRELTVWISDLESYSTYSELMSPTDLVDLLNTVYTEISNTVEEHGGFVAQFVGDAVVAAFGVPLDDPDHAEHAVASAMACCRRVDELSKTMTLPGGLRLHIRIGISTGQLLVGNIGSEHRMSYSIVGDDINLASRLEGVNKVYGSNILVNESTVLQCDSALKFREVDLVRVKGRASPVRIFEPLGPPGSQSADQDRNLAAYAETLKQFRARRFCEAAAGFEALAAHDPVARHFVERARELIDTPPPADWDGVNVLLTK